jgi:hypothetical protein
MNMLRDEENAKYRSYLKKTIEFDPDILKRYVNFMSNPDERTAIDQFGSGDKYYGVCTLLATLPGLPMFGHGQIEGFTERYGMEFKRARMDEHPNDDLVARHQREIAPLLRNRHIFAESNHFVLYDFWTEHGTVDENVFAYSNRSGHQRSLIVYNNRYGSTRGTIHISAASMEKAGGRLRQRSLTEGLALPIDSDFVIAYRDSIRGLEYLRRATNLHHHGMHFDLRGYQYAVLLDWRELRSTAEHPWDALCDALHHEGVYSLDEALSKLRLRPLHESLRQVINAGTVQLFAEVAGKHDGKHLKRDKEIDAASAASGNGLIAPKASPVTDSRGMPASKNTVPRSAGGLDPRLRSFVEKCQNCFDLTLESLSASDRESMPTRLPALEVEVPIETAGQVRAEPSPAPEPRQRFKLACETNTAAAVCLPRLEQSFSTAWPAAVRYTLPSNEPGIPSEQTWPPVLAWIVLSSLSTQGFTVALFDRLLFRSALAEIFSSLGMEGEKMWRAAALVRILLSHANTPSAAMLQSDAFWADPDVRWLAGVNKAADTTYFNREQFEELISWLQLPALLEIASERPGGTSSLANVEETVAKLCRAAKDAGYKLDEFLTLLNKNQIHVDKEQQAKPSAGTTA